MEWTGLDRIGLDRTGLGWRISLGLAELDGVWLVWVGLELSWIGLE